MTENPYQQLAKQFISMWQQQISTSLTDERFVSQMIEMMSQSTNYGTNPYAAAATPHPNPSVSPDPSGDAVVELERRLAATEAKLEAVSAELAELRQRLSDDAKPAAARRGGAGKGRQSGTNKTKRQSS